MKITDPKVLEIYNLYQQVKRKTEFIGALASEIERSPNSLRNHWFGNFWSIPAKEQAATKKFLNKYLKKQAKLEALELLEYESV
jgi:hypothetical protein